jgi:hypothetical protein
MHPYPTLSATVRRLSRRCAAVLVTAGVVAGAHAEPAAPAPSYAVAMTVDAHGEQSAPRVLAQAGQPFAVASGGWRVEMTVRPVEASDDVWLTGKILKGDDVVSAPTLRARLNEAATVRVGDGADPFTLSLVVARRP